MFNEDAKKKDTAPEQPDKKGFVAAAVETVTKFDEAKREAAEAREAAIVPATPVPTEDITEVVIGKDEEEVDMIVVLHKPLKYEGTVYSKIDMTGISEITTNKARDIEKIYRQLSKGSYDASPETTINWAIAATSVVTGLPVEFFNYLNIKDLVKMKNRVINFLYAD